MKQFSEMTSDNFRRLCKPKDLSHVLERYLNLQSSSLYKLQAMKSYFTFKFSYIRQPKPKKNKCFCVGLLLRFQYNILFQDQNKVPV